LYRSKAKRPSIQRVLGFTIVELLIVIVVIGILAAVTIVAYNGVQIRAQNTKTTQAAAEWTKILSAYAAAYGQYPLSSGAPCLSEAGTTCARTTGSTNCFGMGTTSANTSYIQDIKKVVTTLPEASTQEIDCNGAKYKGILTGNSTGPNAVVYLFLRGDEECKVLGTARSVTKNQQEGLTMCLLTMPTVS